MPDQFFVFILIGSRGHRVSMETRTVEAALAEGVPVFTG